MARQFRDQQAITSLYWTAAIPALIWAGYTGMRLRSDRSALVVTSAPCMASATMALAAAALEPELLQAETAQVVIAWLLVSLGLLAARTSLGLLRCGVAAKTASL
jgi:hypothetical protein